VEIFCLRGGKSRLEFLFNDDLFFFLVQLIFYFWGPLEKKSHQNLGCQSAPEFIHKTKSSLQNAVAPDKNQLYDIQNRQNSEYAATGCLKIKRIEILVRAC
jgi:hypothetical protein